jgi:CRISPR-associated protein Csd1
MSALASLVHAYDRLAERGEAPEFGYARTNISFVIILDLDGNPTCMPVDIREPQGKKQNLVGKRLDVPTFLTQRTSRIAPNFLWDKTSYSLGIIEEDLKKPVAKQAKEVSRALETMPHLLPYTPIFFPRRQMKVYVHSCNF